MVNIVESTNSEDEFEEQEDIDTQKRIQQILAQNNVGNATIDYVLGESLSATQEYTKILGDVNMQENEPRTTNNSYGLSSEEYQLFDFDDKNLDGYPRTVYEKLQQALQLNRRFKSALQEQLIRLEAAQQRNSALQRDIRVRIVQQRAINPHRAITTKKPSTALLKKTASTYFFFDDKNRKPADNADAIRRKYKQEKMPLVYDFKKWTSSETSRLEQCLLQQIQEIVMKKILQKHQGNTSVNSAADLARDVIAVQDLTVEEYPRVMEDVDWDRLRKNACPNRTPYECQKKWENELSSRINRERFKREDDKLILELAKQNKGHNWPEIAKQIGDGRRPPIHVFQRFQRSLNVNMMKSKWTEEEDRTLAAAVEYYGERNWQQVAQSLSGRAGQQCLHRWMKTLNPSIKKGRWSIEEDKRLMMAVHAYGLIQGTHPWIAIKNHVPGRTDVQCRERWCNILNPELNSGPWTEEEDQALRKAIKIHGVGKWSLIADLCKPRTDNQCWRRWKTLNSDEVQQYKKQIYKKDKGMVKNFVGREKERPEITVADVDIEIPTDEDEDESVSSPQSYKKDKNRRGPKGRRKYKHEEDNHRNLSVDQRLLSLSNVQTSMQSSHMLTNQFTHLQPILAMELNRQQQVKFLMEKRPLWIGVRPSPFVLSSLNNLKYMASYDPSVNTSSTPTVTTSLPDQHKADEFAFTDPLMATQPGLIALPAVPATRNTVFALATLQRLLYEDEPNADETASTKDKEKATDTPTTDGSSTQPKPPTRQVNYGVDELNHLNPTTFTSPEFRTLTSVFNALFQHSMHRVMSSTATMMPYYLRRVPCINLLNAYFNQEQRNVESARTLLQQQQMQQPKTPIPTQYPQQASLFQLYPAQNPIRLMTEIRQPPMPAKLPIPAIKKRKMPSDSSEQPNKKQKLPTREDTPYESSSIVSSAQNSEKDEENENAQVPDNDKSEATTKRKRRSLRRKTKTISDGEEEEQKPDKKKRSKKDSDEDYEEEIRPRRKSRRVVAALRNK